MSVQDLEIELARVKHERDVLMQAIADAALKAKIWNGEVALTGPHLLMFLEDMAGLLQPPEPVKKTQIEWRVKTSAGKGEWTTMLVNPRETPESIKELVQELAEQECGYSDHYRGFEWQYSTSEPLSEPSDLPTTNAELLGYVKRSSLEWLLQQPAGHAPGISLLRHKSDVEDPVAVSFVKLSADSQDGSEVAEPEETAESLAADVYNHACEIMEQCQRERAARGVEVGTQGSLCDGVAWVYEQLKQTEESLDKLTIVQKS